MMDARRHHPPAIMSRWWIAACLAAGIAVTIAVPALAHPLGNFTINHYTALDARPDGIAIAYVLDLAEIPTFQEIGRLDDAAMRARLGARLRTWNRALHLTVMGGTVPLRLRGARMACLPGAGGLPTLRIEEDLWAGLGGAATPIDPSMPRLEAMYHDANFPARAGWKEIIVTGREVATSSVPSVDRGSHRLRNYPTDPLQPLPADSEARFTIRHLRATTIPPDVPQTPRIVFDLSGCRATAASAAQPPSAGGAGPRYGAESGAFGALLQRLTAGQPGPRVWTIALAGAFLLGAYHALTPGHGKAILAAYFIGERGTPAQALLLGTVVTLTHTSGVFLLGGATLAVSQFVVPETLYPWLGVVSGVMLLSMGASLFRRRLRALRHHHGHDHPHHDHHAHHHRGDRHHDARAHHDHHHHHLPPPDAPLSARDLLALGVTGGLLPCPSALVVMLAAISAGKVLFGLALVTAFSAGLAGVLTMCGVVMLYGRFFLTRFVQVGRGSPARWHDFAGPALTKLPVFSAAAVALLGLVIIIQTLAGTWQGR